MDQIKQQNLGVIEQWRERAKANGQLGAQIPTTFAAIYVDALLSNAMSQQARGEDAKTIKGVLEMALSLFAATPLSRAEPP